MSSNTSRESTPMLVVCRVCASEYAMGGARHARTSCVSCDDVAPARPSPLVLRAEGPLRLAGSARTPEPSRRRIAPRRTGPSLARRFGAVFRGPVLILALAVMGGSAVVARTSIVAAVPHTAVIYAAVGFPVHLGGFILKDASSVVETQNGRPVLVVQGRIENVARRKAVAPGIAITLRGAGGETLYRWSVQPPRPELAPGESAAFRGRLAAPPSGIADVELLLAPLDAGGAVASPPV